MSEIPKKASRRWTSESVLEEIKNLEHWSAKFIQRVKPSLYGAAVRYFGSWKNAVEQSGLNYSQVIGRRSPGYWTSEKVIEELKNLEKRNSGYVRKKHPGLYNAALRIFGTWRDALVAAELPYESIRKGK